MSFYKYCSYCLYTSKKKSFHDLKINLVNCEAFDNHTSFII